MRFSNKNVRILTAGCSQVWIFLQTFFYISTQYSLANYHGTFNTSTTFRNCQISAELLKQNINEFIISRNEPTN